MKNSETFAQIHEGEVPDFELVYRRIKCPRGILPQLPVGSVFLIKHPVVWNFDGLVDEPEGLTVRLQGKFADGVHQSHADFLTWVEVFERKMNDEPMHVGKRDYFNEDNRSFQIL